MKKGDREGGNSDSPMLRKWFIIRCIGREARRWIVYAALGTVGTTRAVDAGVTGSRTYVCVYQHNNMVK